MGRAITKELAMEGVKVLAVARNEELLNSLVEEIEAEGGVPPITLLQDLVAPDAPKKIAAVALEKLKHVDLLINNAGLAADPWIL